MPFAVALDSSSRRRSRPSLWALASVTSKGYELRGYALETSSLLRSANLPTGIPCSRVREYEHCRCNRPGDGFHLSHTWARLAWMTWARRRILMRSMRVTAGSMRTAIRQGAWGQLGGRLPRGVLGSADGHERLPRRSHERQILVNSMVGVTGFEPATPT